MTKREGHIYDKFCKKETVKENIWKASKGKRKYRAVRKIIGKNKESKRLNDAAEFLSDLLEFRAFTPCKTPPVMMKTEYGKVRKITKTPFFPDCCVQHNISHFLRPRWTKALNDDTYACIIDRGINAKEDRYNLNKKIRRLLSRYYKKKIYALILDILKCYHNVDNDVLAWLNRKYCKDIYMLDLLDRFDYAYEGLPIGSYLSQLWINILLNELDRFIKEELKVKHYFRYLDDIVIFSEDKHQLHEWQWRIMNFLYYQLHFEVNHKRQVFPIEITKKAGRGLDFVGYVFMRRHTDLRRRVKKAFIKKRYNKKSLPSYLGLLKHCDSRNLIDKVLIKDNKHMDICDFGVQIERPFDGDKISIDTVIDKPIKIWDFDVIPSKKKKDSSYVKLQIEWEGKKRFIGGGYSYLAMVLERIDKTKCQMPLNTIIRNDRGYYFEGTIKK